MAKVLCNSLTGKIVDTSSERSWKRRNGA